MHRYLVPTCRLFSDGAASRFSHGDASGDRGMSLLLLKGQAVEEPLQLPPADGQGLLALLLGPAKASAFQTSVVEPESVGIPDEDLEFVSTSVAEDEEAVAEQIQLEDLADDGPQAVDGLSQIGAAASQVDA